jgi:hypothetical protein
MAHLGTVTSRAQQSVTLGARSPHSVEGAASLRREDYSPMGHCVLSEVRSGTQAKEQP